MPNPSCNACNTEFQDEASQRMHYRSEWHRHNLMRKVAGIPGVTEALFNLRVEALATEKKEKAERMLYRCSLCAKDYTTVKAHAQHLRSKSHISKTSGALDSSGHGVAVVRAAPCRPSETEQKSVSSLSPNLPEQEDRLKRTKSSTQYENQNESSDEWEEVDADNMTDSESEVTLITADVEGHAEEDDVQGPNTNHMDFNERWDVTQCFVCDARPDGTIESCLEHMHRAHGFFIPDAEYLKDPCGMLNYLGLKVTKGFMCLYCSEKGKHFESLEAVRKHMVAKCHCKLLFEDDENGVQELEEFYDFSSSYVHEDGSEMMAIDHIKAPIDFGTGGFELVVKGGTDGVVKTIGTREFARYYRQRPKPANSRDGILVNTLVERYRNMGLDTKRTIKKFGDLGGKKTFPSARLEAMRSRLGMKNNIIWKLPKNSPF